MGRGVGKKSTGTHVSKHAAAVMRTKQRSSGVKSVSTQAPAIESETPHMQPLVDLLLNWFAPNARDLPWRARAKKTRRDPYHVLVSETMLQQTQVSRVLEKFEPFIARFPNVNALANASEDDVLAAWTGLGYYRRARMLHAAAKAISLSHDGVIPRDVAQLLALPGVGRYTAGAIASLAFNLPAPIVDTNVGRVLLRVKGKVTSDEKEASSWAWQTAQNMVDTAHATQHAGTINEAMMELGALICSAASPACGECPWSKHCIARRDGTVDHIPLPKKLAVRKPLTHVVLLLRQHDRVALHRRKANGLWGGLWQLATLELAGDEAVPRSLREALLLANARQPAWALQTSQGASGPVADFVFQTTHRDVRHIVFETRCENAGNLRWETAAKALELGMASPQRRIVESLASGLF